MIPGSNQDHPTFWRSFGFAIQGFRFTLKSERNIKVMLGGFVFALVVGAAVGLEPVEWGLVILCCAAVVSAELVNTAIETVVDLVSPEYHPLAGRAKDIAAAAVYVLCMLVAVIGVIVFASAAARRWL